MCAAATAPPSDAAAPPPSMGGLCDTYAVIDIGGVQHIVEEGRWYTCNRFDVSPPSTAPGRPTSPARAISSSAR